MQENKGKKRTKRRASSRLKLNDMQCGKQGGARERKKQRALGNQEKGVEEVFRGFPSRKLLLARPSAELGRRQFELQVASGWG
jgi:hypothetical protein